MDAFRYRVRAEYAEHKTNRLEPFVQQFRGKTTRPIDAISVNTLDHF